MTMSLRCSPSPAGAARRAAATPVGITLAVAVTTAGAVAGLGPGSVFLGLAAWAVPTTTRFLQLCGERGDEIDPFTLQDPWLSHVRTSLTHRGKVRHLADSTRAGPLRERLDEVAQRVGTAVDEAWEVGKRGHALSQARRAITVSSIDREIGTLREELNNRPESPDLSAALDALTTQKAAADRLDETIRSTDDRLRLMNARLGEIVGRSAELSAQATDTASATSLSSDVAGLVMDMEALRLALDDVDTGRPPSSPE